MRGTAPIMPNDEWKLQMVGWPKNTFTMTTNAQNTKQIEMRNHFNCIAATMEVFSFSTLTL